VRAGGFSHSPLDGIDKSSLDAAAGWEKTAQRCAADWSMTCLFSENKVDDLSERCLSKYSTPKKDMAEAEARQQRTMNELISVARGH
jgi:hypothetical protein